MSRADEAMPLIGITALNFIQCFNTVGWVTGSASGSQTNLCHREENEGELANPSSSKKQP